MSRTPSILQKLSRKVEIIWEKINGLDFSTVTPVVELDLDESLVLNGNENFMVGF